MPYWARKPLEVFALDEGMNRLTGSIPYKSLTWHRKFYEPGQFALQVPVSIYDPSWAYIYCDDRPETGIIQKVEYTDDVQTYGGDDTVTLSGFFMERFLYDYVFLDEKTAEKYEYHVKPSPVKRGGTGYLPKLYQGPDGKLYKESIIQGRFDLVGSGSESQYTADQMTPVEVSPATGVGEVRPNEWTPGIDSTRYGKNYVTTNYAFYYNETGTWGHKGIYSVDQDGNSTKISDDEPTRIAGDVNTDGWLFHQDGKLVWTPTLSKTVVDKEQDKAGYARAVSKWESQAANHKTVTYLGQEAYVIIRKIKGPYMLRLEVGDVGKEMDSVQAMYLFVRRCFGNTVTYDEPSITGETKKLDPSLQNLGELVYKEMQSIQAAPRFWYSFESNSMVFEVWRGLDRTQAQDKNPWAVFSADWGTVYDYTISRDTSNYKNACYVMYDYDRPVFVTNDDGSVDFAYQTKKQFTDDDLNVTEKRGKWIVWSHKQGYETARLEDDRRDIETFIDARDDKPTSDQVWPRDDIYQLDADAVKKLDELDKAALRREYEAWDSHYLQDGYDKLRNDHPVVFSFDGGTRLVDEYVTGWDLGDLVDTAVEQAGLVEQARVIEVEEVYDDSGSQVRPTFGDRKMTIGRKAVTIG